MNTGGSSSSSPRRRSESRARKNSDVEDLAAVKAAAWAWYQRGVGDEGKSTTEFDVGRSTHEPRPTRFKLESVRLSMDLSSPSSSSSPSGSPGSVLLDRYEREMITRDISFRFQVPNKETESPAPRVGAEYRKKSSTLAGFKVQIPWFRQAIMACQSVSDVADGVIVVGRRQRSRKTR